MQRSSKFIARNIIVISFVIESLLAVASPSLMAAPILSKGRNIPIITDAYTPGLAPDSITQAQWKSLPSHPRLLATDAVIAAVNHRQDVVSRQLIAILKSDAEHKLTLARLEYPPTGFLMDPVRNVQGRILTLSLMYRLNHDKRYLARAREELLQLADLPEWRTSHFLDVGEAALAAGVGLDWLYNDLTPKERERVADAIVRNALLPSLKVPAGNGSWVDGNFNWNQVCHGGLVVGALAVAEREPELARRVVDRAIQNLPKAGAVYAPDGSYAEGPSYWAYGTIFHVTLVEALRSVFGTSCGLEQMPGFLKTTNFMAQIVGPTGQDYNFSDYHSRIGSEPVLLWFARESGRRDPAREELKNLASLDRLLNNDKTKPGVNHSPLSRHIAFGVLWWEPTLPPLEARQNLPLHWTAAGELPIAVMRSAWDDPDATYLAIKGGTPNQSHGHMDVGSFVFEADGVRWALDLGTENYNQMRAAKLDLWNYKQDSSRWTTFRVGPEGHNLLRFDGALQDITGKGEIRTLSPVEGVIGNVVDLTPLYRGQVTKVERTVRMFPDKSLSLSDDWTTGDHPVHATFQWLTTATVTQIPGGVLLTQAGRTLELKIESSATLTIAIEDVSEPRQPQDSPNPGLRRLVIGTDTKKQQLGWIRVRAVPGGKGTP